jgi:hypothetical protein
MWRRLLRFDGTFSTGARFAAAALVTAGFAAGYVARPADGSGGRAVAATPVAKGRIEADLLPARAYRGAELMAVAALPSIGRTARPPKRVHRAARAKPAATPEPTAAAEPVAAPTATPAPAPAATAAPPAPRTAPPPSKLTPTSETFDSSG